MEHPQELVEADSRHDPDWASRQTVAATAINSHHHPDHYHGAPSVRTAHPTYVAATTSLQPSWSCRDPVGRQSRSVNRRPERGQPM